jgi:hypothetical protein
VAASSPHVEFQCPTAANPLEFALLQDTQQLGLKGRRDVADLVEKERAAVGHLEAPPCANSRRR